MMKIVITNYNDEDFEVEAKKATINREDAGRIEIINEKVTIEA